MATTLDDVDAFLLMLKLTFQTFLNCNDRYLIDFIFRFCRLDYKFVDYSQLMQRIKCLASNRVRFFNERKYLKVNLDFRSSDQLDVFENEQHHFKIVFKIDALSLPVFVKNNQKRVIYLPIKLGKINLNRLLIGVVDVKSKRSLGNFKVDLSQIDLLDGSNLKLVYLKTRFVKDITDDAKLYPRIDFLFGWYPFNPDTFDDADNLLLKEQLVKHHQLYLDQHLKLLKYIFVCKLNHNVPVEIDKLLDQQLMTILDQNLFEGALKRVDHFVCIQKVVNELQADEAYKTVDFSKLIDNDLIEKINKEDASLSTDSLQKDDLSFIFRPFDNLNVQLPTDLPFKPVETVFSDISSQLNEKKSKVPFNFKEMKFKFLDDFDATSDKVVIWVSESLNSLPRFYRFSTEKSLNLFDLDHFLRKLSIHIYTSISFRMFICLLVLIEFACFAAFGLDRQMYFIPVHVFDLLITVIAKGLLLNEYSYLSNIWYWSDGCLTILYLAIQIIFSFTGGLGTQIDYYLVGVSMLTILARVFRIIKELKNTTMLSYFRILLLVLRNVAIQLFPLLVLITLVIVFFSIIAMNTMNDIYNHICFPNEFDYQKFERIAEEAIDDLDDEFGYFEMGAQRININQTYFLYDYRPCKSKNWYPLTNKCRERETCMKVSDNVLRYLSRQSPDYLTFNYSYSTFILILVMIFNSNSGTYFYRIIQHTGLYGFIFSVWLFLIGFYIVSLILALVYDSYEEQMLEKTKAIGNKVKFFRKEAEFSFKPDSNFMVCCRYNNSKRSTLKKTRKLRNEFDDTLAKKINKAGELKKLDFESFYKLIEVQSMTKAFETISKFKENVNDFFFDLILTKGHLITLQIEYIVWAKFFINLIIFQLDQPVDYYKIKDEKLRIVYYLLFIDNFLTLFMIAEIVFKIVLTSLRDYFSKIINIFDTCVVLVNVLSFISRLLDKGELTSILSPFTYLRVLSVLYKKWKLLQIIYSSVRLARKQIQANLVFYFIVFIILTVYGHRFLFAFFADEDPDDLTQFDISFKNLYDSSITVFYLLFKFEWTTLAVNYLLFNKETDNQDASFVVEEHRFTSYLPFSFELFLVVSILMHLFFKELFVPQLIYFLDISKLLQLKKIPERDGYFQDGYGKFLYQKQRLMQVYSEFKIKNSRLYSLYYLLKKLSYVVVYLEILNLIYILTRDNLLQQIGFNKLSVLFIGLVFQFIFILNTTFQQINSFNYRKFLLQKTFFYWKFIAYLLEVITLTFTIVNIINHYKVTTYLDKEWFYECMLWIGLFRYINYFSKIRNSIKLLFFNISIIFQCLLLILGLLLFLSFVGMSLFKNRLSHCLVIDGGWFNQRTKAVALTDVFSPESPVNYCVDSIYKNDFFLFQQMQIKVNRFSHFFNFDTVLNALETVFHIMYGSDLSTIQLIASIKDFDGKSKNSNHYYWPYILIVLFIGILIQAFLFSIIAEFVNQSLPIENKFKKIKNKQMRCLFLAMESIKQLLPWEDYRYQKRCRNRFTQFLVLLVSSKFYNNLQLIISLANLIFLTIQWNYDLKLVFLCENLFLLNYLLDGLIRIGLVGEDVLTHISIIVLDLVFPLFTYTLFVSGLRAPNRLQWSTFLFLRFLNPDRYLRVEFLRKSNIILRTIVNSFHYQLYLILSLSFLILCFSSIGLALFSRLDFNFLIFEPNQVSYFYSSLFYSFVHLTSTAFTDEYDSSTMIMRIRNEFCSKTDPYQRYYEIAQQTIVKAVDYRFDLHFLEDDIIYTEKNTLIICNVIYDDYLSSFYLNFTYDPDQIKHLMRIILKNCQKDDLLSRSDLLSCDFNVEDYANKIKYMQMFKRKLNYDLIDLFYLVNRDSINYTFNEIEKQRPFDLDYKAFSNSDHYFKHLANFCSELNGFNRYSTAKFDDEARFYNYSKIANYVHLDFLNVFRLIMSNRFTRKVSLDKICTRNETIRLFYLVFYIISKILVLNILKAILFKRYDLEKLRDQINYFNTDIQEFVNSFRFFKDFHCARESREDYLPVDLILIFVRLICPAKFRVKEETDEACAYVLSKYALKLDSNGQVHLLDLLSVCIAIQLNCSPTAFQFDYPYIIRHLNAFILRTFPTYELDHNKLTSLDKLINNHYLTKFFVLNLSSKLFNKVKL